MTPEQREERNRKAREYRAAHRDEVNAKHREWMRKRMEDPAKREQRQSTWNRWAAKQRLGDTAFSLRERRYNQVKYAKKKFGLSVEEWQERLCLPCEICGKEPEEGKMNLDHDHMTGRIRGTLCQNCNTILGMASDDETVLFRAIDYLRTHAPVRLLDKES